MEVDTKRNILVGGKAKYHWDHLQTCFAKSSTYSLTRAAQDDPEGLLDECRKLGHCVLLIDFESIMDIDPRLFAKRVERGNLIPVLVLVGDARKEQYQSLLRMGCMGFLPPDTPKPQFRRAVEAVTAGEIWAPRKLLSQMFRELLSAYDPLKLTAREEEVLLMLAAGHSNRKIADLLFISRDTVRWHIRAIYRKLGVHDRASAVSFALQQRELERLRQHESTKV